MKEKALKILQRITSLFDEAFRDLGEAPGMAQVKANLFVSAWQSAIVVARAGEGLEHIHDYLEEEIEGFDCLLGFEHDVLSGLCAMRRSVNRRSLCSDAPSAHKAVFRSLPASSDRSPTPNRIRDNKARHGLRSNVCGRHHPAAFCPR
jgi:hypothetical protein